jgi:hypothetical protein
MVLQVMHPFQEPYLLLSNRGNGEMSVSIAFHIRVAQRREDSALTDAADGMEFVQFVQLLAHRGQDQV